MNKMKLPKFLLSLVLVAGFCIVQPRLSAQQQDPSAAQQQPETASPPSQSTMSQASDQQTFSGKVAKAGGKFVLKDTTGKATYMLDDQDKAKQFEGQQVTVSGTLDAQTRTIRVSNISPGS